MISPRNRVNQPSWKERKEENALWGSDEVPCKKNTCRSVDLKRVYKSKRVLLLPSSISLKHSHTFCLYLALKVNPFRRFATTEQNGKAKDDKGRDREGLVTWSVGWFLKEEFAKRWCAGSGYYISRELFLSKGGFHRARLIVLRGNAIVETLPLRSSALPRPNHAFARDVLKIIIVGSGYSRVSRVNI